MKQVADTFFTLLTDPLVREGDQLTSSPSVEDLYGARTSSALRFGNIDLEDDHEARTTLAARVPGMNTNQYSVPLIIPAFGLRSAVAGAVWLLVRRWSRGRWPFLQFDNRRPKTLRGICQKLDLDSGQMSRVIAGSAMFSLPVLLRVLASGGYRLALTDMNNTALKHWIEGQDWRGAIVSAVRSASAGQPRLPLEELPLPTIVPTSRAVINYGDFERLYLEELDDLIDEHNISGIISRTHLSRVRRSERSLSIDLLATIASELQANFLLLPLLISTRHGMATAGSETKPQVKRLPFAAIK